MMLQVWSSLRAAHVRLGAVVTTETIIQDLLWLRCSRAAVAELGGTFGQPLGAMLRLPLLVAERRLVWLNCSRHTAAEAIWLRPCGSRVLVAELTV